MEQSHPGERAEAQPTRPLRVAAYCRVSTRLEEQEGSYEIQVSYFTDKINANSGMTLVGIYGDLGKSGLKTKGRDGLARLMADCEAGKIDLILTKSISRFARNMADCAEMIRKLRELGVGIIFEEENINSKDAKCDLILNIFAALAQEESNSIFLEEKTYKEIAESLEKAGAESQRKCGHFSGTIISYILRNETYVGDKRLHKNPPRDFITKKELKDMEYESVYLTNDHEPIVDRKTWDAVQTILKQREELKKKGVDVRGKNSHFLFGKVKCGECGEYYTRRTFQERRRDENGKPMTYKAWICKEKRKGKKGNGCQNRGIREDVLLQEIAEQLGWDSFDEKRFEEVVEYVVVSKSDIYIKMKNE